MITKDIAKFATTCNAQAITDLATAAQLAHSSIIIAALNIKINLTSLDKEESDRMSTNIENIESDGAGLAEEINMIVASRM